MPLVKPLNPDHDRETQRLADFFNETLEIELFFNPFKSMNKRVILHD